MLAIKNEGSVDELTPHKTVTQLGMIYAASELINFPGPDSGSTYRLYAQGTS